MKFLLSVLACLIAYGLYELFIGFHQNYINKTDLYKMCRPCRRCYGVYGDIWNEETVDSTILSKTYCSDCLNNCNDHIKHSHQMFVLFFLGITIPLVISLMFFEPVHRKYDRFEA